MNPTDLMLKKKKPFSKRANSECAHLFETE